MKQNIQQHTTMLTSEKTTWLDGVSRKLVFNLLKTLEMGHLRLITQGNTFEFGNVASPLKATLEVHSEAAFNAIALGGSVGAGEAYIDGLWSSPDMVTLIRLFAKNLSIVDKMEGGTASLFSNLLNGIYRFSQKNTRLGSKKNIAAHYDLGNDMFELFLDETMMYSCAIYPSESASLHDAQLHRLHHIGTKLQLTADDHLLEIGSGWGALAMYMAQNFGCKVTTTTISGEQYTRVLRRVHEAGLQDRVTVLLQDYRELEGTFTKLVSIEMIEAVGHQFYNDYFETCSRLLADDGLMLIQAILIDDRRYEAAKNAVDYIKRYIFPGSCIPSMGIIGETVRNRTDMSLVHVEDITPHYAKTLHDWRDRFLAGRAKLNKLGYDDTFIRMWDFYFAYCEAGFTERTIRTGQIMFAKPDCRQDCLAEIGKG